MSLAYANITVELKEIFLKNRPQELYDISSKGTVPVLCINNATIIDESLDIMKWALHHNDTENWISNNKKMQFDMIKLYDNEFKHWLDRYKYFTRYPKYNQNYYKEKCNEFLSKLNFLLETNRYLLSNNLLLVDVAIFPFIRQCANVDILWFNNNFINVSSWLNNILSSNLYLSIMGKYDEYQVGQAPLIINFISD